MLVVVEAASRASQPFLSKAFYLARRRDFKAILCEPLSIPGSQGMIVAFH